MSNDARPATDRAAATHLRGRLLLSVGILVGLGLAIVDLVERPGPRALPLPVDAAAQVNGRVISWSSYQRALSAVAADRQSGTLAAGDPSRVLERLIDEELLVQRGLELGLAERDRRVRADLTGAVVDLLTSRAQTRLADPSEADLAAFLAANPDWFRGPPRMSVELIYFPTVDPGAVDATAEIAALTRGRIQRGEVAFDDPHEGASAPPVPPPAGLVSLRRVRDRLGPSLAEAALSAPVGAVSEPIRTGGGFALLRVAAREDGALPDLGSARDLVLAEMRRRAAEEELSRFLQERRQTASIRVAEGLQR